MKFSPDAYATAFLDVAKKHKGKDNELTKRFLDVIKKNGDAALVPKIMRTTEQIAIKRNGGRMVMVESARPLTETQTKELKRHFTANDKIEMKINADLIAGVKIVIDGEWVIDASLRRKLKNLFGNEAAIEMRTTLT